MFCLHTVNSGIVSVRDANWFFFVCFFLFLLFPTTKVFVNLVYPDNLKTACH